MDKTSKKTEIYKLIIPLFVLFETRFFYLFSVGKLDNFISYKVKIFTSLYVIAIFFISLIINKKIKFDKISVWCMLFCVYIIFEGARNISTYNLSFYRFFFACHGYFFILLYPALTIYSDKKKLYNYLINTLTIVSMVLSIIFLIQAFVYNRYQLSFLYLSEYKLFQNVDIRKYGIRMTAPGTIIIFSSLISFGQILGEKKKKLHITNFILGIAYIIFVCQTRMTTLAIILTLLLICFFKFTKNRFGKIKVFGIFLIAIIVLFGPYLIDNIFESDEDASVVARVYAVKHYTKLFLKNPLCGIGLLPDDKEDYTTNKILRGSRGIAHITDVGYVAYTCLLGIIGILFLIMLIKIIYQIIKNNKTKDGAYYSLITCLVYIILTCGTLSIFDTQRIVILPFILYVSHYIEYKNNNQYERKETIDDKNTYKNTRFY